MEMDYEPSPPDPSSSSNPMDDTNMHTITPSTLQQHHTQHAPQQPAYDPRPQTSYSDTGFSRAPYSSQSESGTPDHMLNGSGLSRPPSTQSQGQAGYGAPNGQERQQAQKNASVVIKVGMVGDAQIGKTSLMVKYVEGSWDEDYIQTLGKEEYQLYS